MSEPRFFKGGQEVGKEEFYKPAEDQLQLQVIQSITLARIYDMLLLLYGTTAGNDAMLKVAKAHEQGRFIGPDPALAEDSDEDG